MKISNEQFHLCGTEISLKIYKTVLNELSPILLDVFESWDKFDTMAISSRTGLMSVIYKKIDKKTLETIDPFHF